MSDKTRGAPKRRALLQRGAALVGGALGLGGTTAAAATVAGGFDREPAPATLRLFGNRKSLARAGRSARNAPGAAAAFGELTLAPGAEPIGSFRSSGLGSAGGLRDLPVASLEIQTFELEDGTLFGIGAPPGRGEERHRAVLGGTGRYSAASGSYVERPAEEAGLTEFTFTLKG